MKAWHFVGKTLRDGRPVPADGVKLVHDGPLKMCVSGLHFSLKPFDALKYAPGSTLCLVECGGTIVNGTGDHNDKGICSERTIIVRMETNEMLRYFARMRAVSVAHLWDMPQIMCNYLMTGDERIRAAARAAAWDAAQDDARAAAQDDARAAAQDDARAAAQDDARAAAQDDARAAARAAAQDDARAAAWDDARAAAQDAVRAAAWDEFNTLVYECFADWV